jgi:hypothetical protein
MPLIEDKYSDTVGRIIFPVLSSNCYEAISAFYEITGAVPYAIEEHPDEDCVTHLVRLRNLPSLTPTGITTVPEYTVEYQTASFEQGVTRMNILNGAKQCVVRFERGSGSEWSSFAFDKPRLKFFTD